MKRPNLADCFVFCLALLLLCCFGKMIYNTGYWDGYYAGLNVPRQSSSIDCTVGCLP